MTIGGPSASPSASSEWGTLPRRAKGFRLAHMAWGVVELSALTYVWACAALRRRDRALAASIALLIAQGAALVIGRGDCPLGPFQRRLGDPVPMFELVLPRRAAKAAIPVLFIVAVGGMLAALVRPPRRPPTSAYVRLPRCAGDRGRSRTPSWAGPRS